MLRPRVIPCLLVQNKGLVKTVRFGDHKYVGDPLNAVRIFNEKKVDELMVLDIDASVQHKEPDYKMIENLATECRMPLCYGGGIKSVDQVRRILSLGVEKVSLNSAVIARPELINEIAVQVGAQSVVVVLDVKKRRFGSQYDVYTKNGKQKESINLVDFVKTIQELGVGEIILNSIDRDGTMQGYDLELIKKMRLCVNKPMTVLGGAGSLDHIAELFRECNVNGAAAGSLFVFKGKFRAVLISYPSETEKNQKGII